MTALFCLATAIFFEARGESYDGKLAVGQVIMNRVESEKFKNDVCSVVYRKHQFSFTSDGLSDDPLEYALKNPIEMKAWINSIFAADDVINNKVDILPTSTYYHSINVNPNWATAFQYDGRIGNHLFYSNV